MSTYSQTIYIAGAGIMGLLTAHTMRTSFPYALITLSDGKGFPAKNASAMAGGMLAPYSETEYLPDNYFPAALHSLNFWKNFAKDRSDIELKETGSLIVCHPSDRHILKRFETHLQKNILTFEKLNKQTLHQKEKLSIFPEIDEAIFIKEEAHLNPQATINALLDLQFPKIAEDVNISEFQNQLNKGDWIIDCRGLGANDPDIRGVKGETLIVYNPDFHINRPVRLMHPRYPLYIVPRPGNIFMIGATVIESSNNTSVSMRSAMELMSALHVISPSFADAAIVDIKAGIRPAYPDNLPRIKIDKGKRTISCNGLFRHGYLLAPVMAECVADHIAGKTNKFMPLFNKGINDESNNQRAA